MSFESLISLAAVKAIAEHGLHKVAGAMLDAPELTLKTALQDLGAKAYLRRKEARVVADGIAAYAAVTGEKIAENPVMMAALQRAIAPALLGAGIGGVTHMMNNDPNKGSAIAPVAAGAFIGGTGGLLNALHASTNNAPYAEQVASSLHNFDRPFG